MATVRLAGALPVSRLGFLAMPFPYSIRTSVRCAERLSAEAALEMVADSLKREGAAVHGRPDGSFSFGVGNRALGRHWLSGVTDGRVSAQSLVGGVVITAQVAYPTPLVLGTLAAIVVVAVAGPVAAAVAWLWLVGGNYVFALMAIRSHLKKAS